MTRDTVKILMRLVRDEIVFLDRGYGSDKPPTLVREYQGLQAAYRELEGEMNRVNEKEFPSESQGFRIRSHR